MRVNLEPRDAALAVATFAAALAIFALSPVRQFADSHYSLLLSESLLRDHTNSLDRFFVPPLDPTRFPGLVSDRRRDRPWWLPGLPYQIEASRGNLYYRYPPGTSLMSLPFVAALRVAGVSSIGPDGRYDVAGEHCQQVAIASFLMAVFACLCYLSARVALPRGASLAVAAGAALATPVWSTASRGLWSHDWGLVLVGLVVYGLLRSEIAGRDRRPVLLGTLLAWSFFVRPTHSITALVVTGLVASRDRRAARRLVLTGALWLGAFLLWNLATRGKPLPGQYETYAFTMRSFVQALAGHLVSPSRGLLVFCPLVVMLGVIGLRACRGRRLVAAGVAASALHLVPLSLIPTWWGGHSYGPRLMTDLIPWFVSWAVVGWAFGPRLAKPERVLAAGLLVWGVAVHARGALCPATWAWNVRPWNVDQDPSRLWDWSDAQFLAGVIRPIAGAGEAVTPLGSRIPVGLQPTLLFRGWSASGPVAELRGRRGIVVFRSDRPRPPVPLRLRVGFASPPTSAIPVRLGGRWVGDLPPAMETTLHIPEMALPDVVGLSFDRTGTAPLRLIWIELAPEPRHPPRGCAIAVGMNEAEPYLGPGWSWPEGRFRWTEGARAEVRFKWAAGQPARLTLRARPFLASGRLLAQRVDVVFNERPIAAWVFDELVAEERWAELPGTAMEEENRLWLELPDATVPGRLGVSPEPRTLALAVEALGLEEVGGRRLAQPSRPATPVN
jgi:hypothetical protein